MNPIATTSQSDVFSFSRLYWFARKEILENWKLYVYSLSAIIIWYILFYGIKFYSLLKQPLQEIQTDEIGGEFALIIALFWVSISIACYSFDYFETKNKTLAALTVPVSVLERLVLALLTIIFFVSMSIIFWKIIDLIATPLFYQQFSKLGTMVVNTAKGGSRYDLSNSWAILLALFMLGSIWLGRFSFFKTVGILFGTWLVGYLVNGLWFKSFLKSEDFANINNIWLGLTANNKVVSKYEPVQHYWFYCLPVLLLVTIYFKIKDKEA